MGIKLSETAVCAENSAKTAPGRPFKKGKSGNPGGRPAVAKEFREKCREFMETEGWVKLFSLAQKEGKEQRYALELVCAYAYGRPRQGVELTGEDGGPIQSGQQHQIDLSSLSVEELKVLEHIVTKRNSGESSNS